MTDPTPTDRADRSVTCPCGFRAEGDAEFVLKVYESHECRRPD